MKTKISALLIAALLLSGCQGKPLPIGMNEDDLLAAGKDVVLLFAGGDYQGIWDLLRDDVAETTSPEDIQSLAQRQLDGAGVYKQIDSSMTTAQSSDGESYGIAVLYCSFSKGNVLFRLAFDTDMVLIGMEIKKQ